MGIFLYHLGSQEIRVIVQGDYEVKGWFTFLKAGNDMEYFYADGSDSGERAI